MKKLFFILSILFLGCCAYAYQEDKLVYSSYEEFMEEVDIAKTIYRKVCFVKDSIENPRAEEGVIYYSFIYDKYEYYCAENLKTGSILCMVFTDASTTFMTYLKECSTSSDFMQYWDYFYKRLMPPLGDN